MTLLRERVVAEAMSWLGTPYAHRQRLKGVGVDCAQLPLAVYAAAGLIGAIDVGAYAPQWHLHRGEELYLGWVERFGREIAREAAGPGDFALWRYGRTFSHGAILLDGRRVIHARRGLGVVVEDVDADEELRTRPFKLFSMFDTYAIASPYASGSSDDAAIILRQSALGRRGQGLVLVHRHSGPGA